MTLYPTETTKDSIDRTSLALRLSAMGVRSASSHQEASRFPSGLGALDEFFDGGLPLGSVIEWGAPWGRGGRELLFLWLSRLTEAELKNDQPKGWALWVYSKTYVNVYAPAWIARGVNLQRMRFASTPAPLRDLRPVFLDPLFRIIVLDAPSSFTEEDCSFVARQARASGQLIILVRDQALKPDSGSSVWAKLRVNCWRDEATSKVTLDLMRGSSPRRLTIEEADISSFLKQRAHASQTA